MFKGKNIAVFGLGKSGTASVEKLSELGADVLAFDDSENAQENPFYHNLYEADWSNIDLLVMSPGIPLHFPKPHKIVELARAANCPIICDIEILYLLNRHSKFIGITGTNGKSTTTDLVYHVMQSAGLNVQMGGNIGNAALSLKDGADYYLLEMSSYQLDLIDKTNFDIACILNITPDHIDRHGNFENYFASKRKIFKNQNSTATNFLSQQIYDKAKPQTGNNIMLSNEKTQQAIYTNPGGQLFDNYFEDDQLICDLTSSQYLLGSHNWQNMGFCYVICKQLGIDKNEIVKHMMSYKGLAHRMEIVLNQTGKVFINDSKATNAEAADKALKTFEDNIYWIAGGQAKEGGINQLTEHFSKINKAYLIGEAANDFKTVLDKNGVDNIICETLENALINIATDIKQKNAATILLSPACASWDQWQSFEARGNYFRDWVLEKYV